MAKVTVTICDACKERIAASACPICELDLCKPCTKNLSMELGVKFGPRAEFFNGAMCSKCYKEVEKNYKHIIGKLSTELGSNVSRVLKDAVGTVARPAQTQITEVPKNLTVSSDQSHTGGYQPPAREETNISTEVTRAELPEGMNVTTDL